MFPLVTQDQVTAILDNDPEISLIPFIQTADNLVQNVLVPYYGTTNALNVQTLTNVELWLSAHFYAIMRPRTAEEIADGITDRFDSKVDLGLKVTRYGQMALVLDVSGLLATYNFEAMGQGIPRPKIAWLGNFCNRRRGIGTPPNWNY